MRLIFADPPYMGMCKRYDHYHPDGRCWDDLETHAVLLDSLRSADGWAYCLSSTTLRDLLPLAPSNARIGAWAKSFCAFKRNVRIAYSWEPILFVPGRDRSKDGAPVGRDHLVEPITLKRGLVGAKPERFCRWVLTLMGYVPGDEVVDLYPGTGIMGDICG